MSDNEIRILGFGARQESKKDIEPPKTKKWLWIILLFIAIGTVLVFIFIASHKLIYKKSAESSTTDTLSEETIKSNVRTKCVITKKDTTINDIPLTVIIPQGGKVSIHIGQLPQNDKSIVLAAQAADIREDNDLPTGAFVYNGELISKGHSKYGFCAIIGNSITLGRKNETPLFEKAIEENGCFFRQYSLVSNGLLMDIPPKGKAMRRALCLYNNDIVVIETKDKESYHDFSQSLVDLGVKEGLSLVGGDGHIMYRLSGETIIEGSPLKEKKESENYIIWR